MYNEINFLEYESFGGEAVSAYRLAICEDDALILTELKSICSDILTGDGIENEITVFHSAKALHSFLLSQSNPFDMLVLDFQMKERNKRYGCICRRRVRLI